MVPPTGSLLLALAVLAPSAPRTDGQAFELVALPDTQMYTVERCYALGGLSYLEHFRAQTAWIATNRATSNIRFVTHLGDVVENGAHQRGAPCDLFPGGIPVPWSICVTDGLGCPVYDTFGNTTTSNPYAQFLFADSAMAAITGVPWSVCLGNHDFDCARPALCGFPQYSVNAFRLFYGPQRFVGQPWYVSYHDRPDATSSAQIFDDGAGNHYLHLNLEFHPRDECLAWAQDVLTTFPALPTIVSTHKHLGPGVGGRHTSGASTHQATRPLDPSTCGQDVDCSTGLASIPSSTNSGWDVYQKLMLPFPQVFLLLCGNDIGRSLHLKSNSLLDTPVFEVLADFQDQCEGGMGWFRRMRFDPPARCIDVVTQTPYSQAPVPFGLQQVTCSVCPPQALQDFRSPTSPHYADNNFRLSIDLDGHRERVETRTIHRFRRGASFGGGAVADTYVTNAPAEASVAHGSLPGLRAVDDARAGVEEQVLLRFDVGASIAPDAVVERAIVTLTFEDDEGLCATPPVDLAASSSPGTFHSVRAVWDESSTWQSLGGSPALASVVARTDRPAGDVREAGRLVGTLSFDVTPLVREWVWKPENNRGLALVLHGADQARIRSSEWAYEAERPMLTVVVR